MFPGYSPKSQTTFVKQNRKFVVSDFGGDPGNKANGGTPPFWSI